MNETAHTYSHLNGEEYLMVCHGTLYEEIEDVGAGIDASTFRTKAGKEKWEKGNNPLSPVNLNNAFNRAFSKKNWTGSRYSYSITLDRAPADQSVLMSPKEQKKFPVKHGEKEPIDSDNQTDFVKEKIAVEVPFGKYAFVAYDLFVEHMLFYLGGVINLGVEMLPTKKMQAEMSSGVAYYEGAGYNIIRQGRNSPPVPLLVLGIES